MNKKAGKKVAVFLICTTLLSVLAPFIAPEVSAIASISISPTSGFVGDPIQVDGTIDTVNGSFTVRWNQALNVTGTAVVNNISASFAIPPTAGAPSPSGRNVTVELIDETLDAVVAAANFTIFTKFDTVVETPQAPRQLREGTSVRVNVTVTGGELNTVYVANITVSNAANQSHWVYASLSNTTASGSGLANVIYPTNFPAGANMNYTGTYKVSFNETITKEFAVGLTDKTEYRRNEDVQVQGAGYKSSEPVKVDIKTDVSSVAGFPKSVNASSGGLITLSWRVPTNATAGTYHVTLTNTTSAGTFKTPSDAQSFNVTGVACLVQAKNLADEPFAGALIEVYNASAPTSLVSSGSTNLTGWIRFNLETGNYTFRAFVRNVEVYTLKNQTITTGTQFLLPLRLVNFVTTVETEQGNRIPLIDITLNYTYTARDNTTVVAVATAQTNITGTASFRNLFTNVTYKVEAKRYGLLFNTTTLAVELQPTVGSISLDLTLPAYMLTVHVLDAKESDAADIDIRVYEWASGIGQSNQTMKTGPSGDAFFVLLFGRYILRAYKDSDFLGETVVDLDEPSAFTFNLRTLNVDVTVSVLDYFGQPIANAEVRIERKVGQNFLLISTQFTGGTGSTLFASVVGGDCRLSVYVAGNLAGIQTQFLGSGSSQVTFRTGQYVALLGYPIAAATFALLVFVIVVLIVLFLVLARKRPRKVLGKKPKR